MDQVSEVENGFGIGKRACPVFPLESDGPLIGLGGLMIRFVSPSLLSVRQSLFLLSFVYRLMGIPDVGRDHEMKRT